MMRPDRLGALDQPSGASISIRRRDGPGAGLSSAATG
jgi:hypothetical protein